MESRIKNARAKRDDGIFWKRVMMWVIQKVRGGWSRYERERDRPTER